MVWKVISDIIFELTSKNIVLISNYDNKCYNLLGKFK